MRTMLLLSGLLMVGCAKKEEAGEATPTAEVKKAVYACNAPSENQFNCVEWAGGAFDEAGAKAECTANRGKWAGNACPAEKRIGTCVRHAGTPSEQREHWYAGSKTVTVEGIQKPCEGSGGKFTAGS